MVILTLWCCLFNSSSFSKWKEHRISGPWVVTGSQTAWATVNGPEHDLSWCAPRFQHLSSLLLFSPWMTVKTLNWRAEVTCGDYTGSSTTAQILCNIKAILAKWPLTFRETLVCKKSSFQYMRSVWRVNWYFMRIDQQVCPHCVQNCNYQFID